MSYCRYFNGNKSMVQLAPVLPRFVLCLLFWQLAASFQVGHSAQPLQDVLTPVQWQCMDKAVDRGLEWLASQQGVDGSFHSNRRSGQPGITSLCIMAYLARGHRPGEGPYGEHLERAIEFTVSCQKNEG